MGLISGLMLGGAGALGGIAQGVTGAISAGKQAGAYKDAAAAQTEAAKLGIEEQKRQMQAFEQLMAPYRNAGGQALTRLQQLTGMGGPMTEYVNAAGDVMDPNKQKAMEILQGYNKAAEKRNQNPWLNDVPIADMSAFEGYSAQEVTAEEQQRRAIEQLRNDPQMLEQIRQGEEAILSNASATGGLRGGNTQAALAQFAPQMLNQRIQQEMAYLTGLTNMGQGAAGATGGAGLNSANAIANLYNQSGEAAAQGALGQGAAAANLVNAIGGGIGSIGNIAGQVGGMHLGSMMLGGPGLGAFFGGGGAAPAAQVPGHIPGMRPFEGMF